MERVSAAKICALQMDAIDTINIHTDTTFILAKEAIDRGYQVYHYRVDDLCYEDGEVFAFMRPFFVKYRRSIPAPFLGESRKVDLKAVDVIWLRQDPPFNMAYVTNTHLLELVAHVTTVVNDPRAVRNAPEKLLVTRFPHLCAPTLIASDSGAIDTFRKKHKDIIVKSLYACGGKNVFHVKPQDENLHALLQLLFDTNGGEPVVVQKFLPGVRKGDKRIILINGLAKAVINRIPCVGEIRANIHAGGSAEKSDLSMQEQEICQTIGDYLRRSGLLFVGVDVIDGYLTEINVTSPTCVQETNRLYGMRLEQDIWDAVEQKMAS